MSFPIRPLGPKDVVKSGIPEFVIEAVNELISEKYNDSSFVIRQNEVKDRIMSKTTQDFDWEWLNFEKIYRDAGWYVEYDKPAYCESYEAFFKFTPKR